MYAAATTTTTRLAGQAARRYIATESGGGSGGSGGSRARALPSPGFWKSLSPRTRRNAGCFLAVCAATDAVVLYAYPEMVGLGKKKE